MTTANPPAANATLKDRTVLIIEDDEIMLRALGHAFQRAGCRVVGARDGDQGLARGQGGGTRRGAAGTLGAHDGSGV